MTMTRNDIFSSDTLWQTHCAVDGVDYIVTLSLHASMDDDADPYWAADVCQIEDDGSESYWALDAIIGGGTPGAALDAFVREARR